MLPLSLSHQDWHSQAGFATVIVAKVLKPQDEHHIEMITSQLYEWMYACPLQGYRTLSPRLSANIGRSDSYRLSGIILNCTQLYYNCIFPFSVLYSYFIKHQKVWYWWSAYMPQYLLPLLPYLCLFLVFLLNIGSDMRKSVGSWFTHMAAKWFDNMRWHLISFEEKSLIKSGKV